MQATAQLWKKDLAVLQRVTRVLNNDWVILEGMIKLCVITGAGASTDIAGSTASASLISSDWTPPVTCDLFQSRPSFDPILQSYPQANPLVHRIRTALRHGESLEVLLSKVYHSRNPREKKQLKYLTYFLRHLFQAISDNYIQGGPSHYDRLVDEVLRRDIEVLFLTLNYDLFLEKALESNEGVRFNGVEGYVPKDRQWRLVKLHGSVNWGRKLLKQPLHLSDQLTSHIEPVIDELDLDRGLDDQIVVTLGAALPIASNTLLYPAMVIPIEDKYEFVCPAEHACEAKEFLKTCPNFLVVGCSMKDKDVLDLLSENVSDVTAILINGNTKDGCNETQSRMRAIPAFGHCDSIYAAGFNQLMTSGKLETFLDSLT